MANGANNRRASLSFMRKHRAMIDGLQRYLAYVERADARAITRATANGVPPVTFTQLEGVTVQAAIDTLKARCTAAKLHKS